MSSHHRLREEASFLLEQEDSIESYVPSYMRRVVIPLRSDFCHSPLFHPQLIVQLMAEGFLPIAAPGALLLPKLHRQRCVIPLQQQQQEPSDSNNTSGHHPHGGFHIRKSTKKKAKRFYFTFNREFDRVVEGCRAQHRSCWLYPELVASFQKLHDRTTLGDPMHAKLVQDGTTCPVRIYSMEVWNEQGELVAGELGYTVGSIYTSLTGFSFQDSAGSVQMAVLGHLLIQNGFTLWDLGMDMEYKRDMGAILLPRREFVARVHAVRVMADVKTVLPVGREPRNCKAVIAPQVGLPDSPVPTSPHPSHPAPFTDEASSVKKPRGVKWNDSSHEEPTDSRPKLARVSLG